DGRDRSRSQWHRLQRGRALCHWRRSVRMTDENMPSPALPPLAPDGAVAMTALTPTRAVVASTLTNAPHKRNAKPKPRYRNAGRAAARVVRRRNAGPTASHPTQLNTSETFVSLLQSLAGAGATSVVGAYAVRWGLPPWLVSAGLLATGGYFAWQSDEKHRRQ